MNANTKSLALLAATLVVGFALGLFADATLRGRRRERIGQIGRPPGFVDHMERVIQPHTDAQRDSIKPLLEHVAQQNGQALRDANVRLRAVLDSMRVSLAPMLDSAQRDRLKVELDRMPGPFRGGPGRPGRGGRGGPPPP